MAASFEARITTKQKKNECEGGGDGGGEKKREMTKYSQAGAALIWQAGARQLPAVCRFGPFARLLMPGACRRCAVSRGNRRLDSGVLIRWEVSGRLGGESGNSVTVSR